MQILPKLIHKVLSPLYRNWIVWGVLLTAILYPVLSSLENHGNAFANEFALLVISASSLATLIRHAVHKLHLGKQKSARRLFILASIFTCIFLLEYIPRRTLYSAGFRKDVYLKPGICLLFKTLSPAPSHRELIKNFDWTWATPFLTRYTDYHFYLNDAYTDLSGLRRCKNLRYLKIPWKGELSEIPPMPELRKLIIYRHPDPSGTGIQRLFSSIHPEAEVIIFSHKYNVGSRYYFRSGDLITVRLKYSNYHSTHRNFSTLLPLDHLTELTLHVDESKAKEAVSHLAPLLPEQITTIPLASGSRPGKYKLEGTYHMREKRFDWLPKGHWVSLQTPHEG